MHNIQNIACRHIGGDEVIILAAVSQDGVDGFFGVGEWLAKLGVCSASESVESVDGLKPSLLGCVATPKACGITAVHVQPPEQC